MAHKPRSSRAVTGLVVAVALVLLAHPVAVSAVTVYVNPTLGDDAGTCDAAGAGACKTIAGGVAKATNDGTIILAAGAYTVPASIGLGGKAVTVLGAGVSNTTVTCAPSVRAILLLGNNDGLEWTDTTFAHCSSGFEHTAKRDMVFTRCIFAESLSTVGTISDNANSYFHSTAFKVNGTAAGMAAAMVDASQNATITMTSCSFTGGLSTAVPFFRLDTSDLTDTSSTGSNNLWAAWAEATGKSYVKLTNSRFTNNTGVSAGVLSVQGSTRVVLDGLYAADNSGVDGGVVYSRVSFSAGTGTHTLMAATGCTFLNNHAQSTQAGGGAMDIIFLPSTSTTKAPAIAHVNITDCVIKGNSAANGGGLQLTSVEAQLWDTQLVDNTATGKGGGLSFLTSGSVWMQNVTATGNKALFGGAFDIDNPNDKTSGYFSIDHCTVQGNSATSGGVLAITAEVESLRITATGTSFSGNTAAEEGGVFWYQGSGMATFSDCTFESSFAPTGGVLRQTSTFVSTFNKCHFRNNRAMFGAAAATNGNSRAVFDNCTVSGNVASNEGGFSYSKSKSVVAMRNSEVTFNSATRGGAFFGQDDTNTTVDFCAIAHNTADNGAVAYMLGDVTNGGRPFFLVAESQFDNNTAEFGGVEFASVATFSTFDDSSFRGNEASASGGVFYVAGNSVINVDDCVAEDNVASFDGGIGYFADITVFQAKRSHFLTSSALRGGALFATDQSVTDVDSSYIIGNRGSMGGAIHLDGVPYSTVNAKMNVTNTKVQGNFGTQNGVGGAAFLSGTTSIFFVDCDLLANKAQFGGVIYSRDSSAAGMYLSRATGNSARQGGVVYGDTATTNTLVSTTCWNNSAEAEGGVVYLTNFAKAVLDSSDCTSNMAMSGGVVATTLTSRADIKDSTFQGNNATYGGAIYLEGTTRTRSTGICQNSKLITNFASAEGGALWIGESAAITSIGTSFIDNVSPVGGAVFAQQRIKSGDIDDCKTFEFNGDKFLNNVATISGGILSWNLNDNQTYSPCNYCGTEFRGCDIEGNRAGLFRPNTSTPLVASIFVSSNHWLESFSDRVTNDTVSAVISSDANTTVTVHTTTDCNARDVKAFFPTLTSGNPVFPTLVISGKDFYGQEFTDPDSRANLVVSVADPTGTAQLGGQTVASTELGEVEFSNLIIIGKPGDIQKIRFTVLEPTEIEPLDMWVQMRPCRKGEVQPINSNRCTKCPRNKFSWDPSEQVCHDCPAKALCIGGDAVMPFAGYWRSSNSSTIMHACPRQLSCLGAGVEQVELLEFDEQAIHNPEGCAEGYQGRLCHRCAKGYGRSGADGCTECPDQTLNVLLISTGVIVAFGVMGFLIYTTRKSAKNEKDLMMMMIKIFMSYIQFVSLAAGLEINWPSSLSTLFRAQQGAGSVTELFISFDCALDSPAGPGVGTDTELFYKTQIMYFFIPFMGVATICLFWAGMYLFRGYCRRAERRTKAKLREIMKENAIVSCIVLLFFMHPTLTTRTFMMFACQEIDEGQYFLVQDLDIACYDVQHTLWIMSVGLPAVIIFVIGIPLGAFVVMYRRKPILHTEHCRATFGFLYSGFEYKFFYWECVIMIRKVLVISIVVFFSQFGALVQTGAALGLVYLAYNAHIWAMPYEADVLDDLEKYSLLTSLFTFFAGVFLNAEGITVGWAVFLVVLIFIAQVGYLLLFINTIRGEVMKKVEEVKSKVLERARADTTPKTKDASGKRELTDAEKQAEAEYLARMRQLETDAKASSRVRRRPQPAKKQGFFARLFGKKSAAPPRRLKGRGSKGGGRRRNPTARGSGSAKPGRDVDNPLNTIAETKSSASGAGAGAGAGAGRLPPRSGVPRREGGMDVTNPLNTISEDDGESGGAGVRL